MMRFLIIFLAAAMLSACAGQNQPTPGATVQVVESATPPAAASPTLETPEAASALPTREPATVEPPPAETAPGEPAAPVTYEIQEYPVPRGSHPHDVAPAANGGVWYTAQWTGELGWLDPATGETRHIPLGAGSAPHGVIVGPDGAAWITDSGLNAMVRVDPQTDEVQVYPLPAGSGNANLNTAAFDARGILWFTGQNGVYGRLDPASGEMADVCNAPRGRGPYGITTTPGRRGVLRLAGGQLRGADRPGDGRGDRIGSAHPGPGRPAGVV
jgi:streptogramin lyase